MRESFKVRDGLQKQLEDFRGKLEATIQQRDKLQTVVENQESQNRNSVSGLKEKDDKIFNLSRELNSWQARVPPLVEKFQERDQQAKELEAELAKAQERIASFEEMARTNQTRIEPVDAGSLDSLDASNEPHTDTIAPTMSDIQDQIDNETGERAIVEGPDAAQQPPESDDAGDELIAADAFVEEEDKGEVALESQTRQILDEETGTGGDKDDLKQIKGVGPAIEKTLNELGIYSFNQIAEMSEYEIDRVAQRLKGFRSRIYRQDWIGQARDLQYQKTNNLT